MSLFRLLALAHRRLRILRVGTPTVRSKIFPLYSSTIRPLTNLFLCDLLVTDEPLLALRAVGIREDGDRRALSGYHVSGVGGEVLGADLESAGAAPLQQDPGPAQQRRAHAALRSPRRGSPHVATGWGSVVK